MQDKQLHLNMRYHSWGHIPEPLVKLVASMNKSCRSGFLMVDPAALKAYFATSALLWLVFGILLVLLKSDYNENLSFCYKNSAA